MNDTLGQFIRLGLIILVLAALLGWAETAYFAPRRLPPCHQESLPPGHICLTTLHRDYPGRVVWIDARSASDYELNHLMLSENRMFPIRRGPELQRQMDAAIGRLIEASERGECIVVFCSKSCNAADDIAAELRSLGLLEAPVYTLEGGWDALRADGMLIE